MRVKDKSIIVTGAGSGIGKAMAMRFAQEGANVIVNDISETGNETVREIHRAGGRAFFFQADMTKSDQVKELVDAAIIENRRLDVFVNNAGWTHLYRPALEVTEEEFDKVYSINVKSIYLSAMHAVPIFRKQGGGSFINIGSTAGVRPPPGLTWYNGSKAAVIITSKSMAAEFGPDNIRTNVINPGFNPHTGLSEEFAGGPLTEDRIAVRIAAVPLRRLSTLSDVSSAALYLASDEASFINGICIEVDGGRSI